MLTQIKKHSRHSLASLPKMILAAGCVVLVAFGNSELLAQDIEATASPDGILIVEGVQFLPNSCQSIGPIMIGAPVGVAEIKNAQSFKLEITHSGAQMCAQIISEAPFRVELPDYRSKPFVVVYRTYEGFPDHSPETEPFVQGEIVMKRFLE